MTGVNYARYSSDNQREEPIEGQLRECNAFAEKNGTQIDPLVASAVLEAFKRYAEGASMTEIAQEMNAKGLHSYQCSENSTLTFKEVLIIF